MQNDIKKAIKKINNVTKNVTLLIIFILIMMCFDKKISKNNSSTPAATVSGIKLKIIRLITANKYILF